MSSSVILKTPPVVACIAEMQLQHPGIITMLDWVRDRRPECLPAEFDSYENDANRVATLFPHPLEEALTALASDPRLLTGNELLVELAGRKCYDSFGLKAGRKTNREYIANTQMGDVPHRSIAYHAKMSFFIGGVSRRVSHELIRNYVGADRDEEGSPSQESTRYVEHAGRYIVHPGILEDPDEVHQFSLSMAINYSHYLEYIRRRFAKHELKHGAAPTGMDRKRIYESASAYLSHSCETSFIWTTNPMALAKLFLERDHDAADGEFRRLAQAWKKLCVAQWPNLFPQTWMRG